MFEEVKVYARTTLEFIVIGLAMLAVMAYLGYAALNFFSGIWNLDWHQFLIGLGMVLAYSIFSAAMSEEY